MKLLLNDVPKRGGTNEEACRIPLHFCRVIYYSASLSGRFSDTDQEVNSIALLKSQQTFQQSFYSSGGHTVLHDRGVLASLTVNVKK